MLMLRFSVGFITVFLRTEQDGAHHSKGLCSVVWTAEQPCFLCSAIISAVCALLLMVMMCR